MSRPLVECPTCRRAIPRKTLVEVFGEQPTPTDAEVEAALSAIPKMTVGPREGVPCEISPRDTLRAALAAKDKEIERLRRTYGYGEKLAAQLVAAENRGFRKAAGWLEEPGGGPPHYGYPLDLNCPCCDIGIDHHATTAAVRALRAEADRREGKE
jgi:hypothetical protein